MTRLPTESRAIQGIDGPAYELNFLCAAPGCNSPSADPHHLWRRSETIGPYNYVWIEDDDIIVGNVVGLCRKHHDMITQNAAWITWYEGKFMWSSVFDPAEPLSFQPPSRLVEDGLLNPPEKNGGTPVSETTPQDGSVAPVASENLAERAHVASSAEGTCPTCLRPLPHHKEHHEAKRARRTWSVTVPKDEREDGAQTLDRLLEEARQEMARAGLPYGDEDSVKFFVLSGALGLFVTHAKDVLA